MTSNTRAREDSWTRPAVVDIRSIREAHRSTQPSSHTGVYPRRNKILHFTNFTNDVPEHVITMATPDSAPRSDDDPDFPTAA
jgi:hypothetical protein